MAIRKLNITIQLADNDVIQWKLEQLLNKVIGEENIVDSRVLANTDKLYESSEQFRKLLKAKKKASDDVYEYINKYKE